MQSSNKNLKSRLIRALDPFFERGFAITPLLGNKAPYRENWQHESPLDKSALMGEINSGRCKGLGIRTGRISGGLVAVDLDGPSAYPKMLELSGGEELPLSVAFTSGRPGRKQVLLRVPEQYWEAIHTKKIKTGVMGDDGKPEQLELRWDGCQSVLPPSVHPTTGQYHWAEGLSPGECDIALAPLWVIEFMLTERPILPTANFSNVHRNVQVQYHVTGERWTNIDWALSYLGLLSPSRADDYDDWLAVGMALHSVDDTLLTEWDKWSQQSPKYKPGVCEKKWKSFKRSGVSIGTLAHLARQDGWRTPFEKRMHSVVGSSDHRCDRPSGRASNKSDGDGGCTESMSTSILSERIKEILHRYDAQSMRDAALMDLASGVGRNFRELEQLAKILQLETDLGDDATAAANSLGKLLSTRRTSLDPHDYFEGHFADLLQSTALAMPTAVEFLITTLLPVAAACIGTSSHVVIKAKGGYVQPLVIWSAIVGQSGGLKTPAQKAIIKPLMALEALYYQEYKEALKAYNEEISVRRAHPEQYDSEPEPIAPVRQRLVTKDCTLEKLQRIHSDNPRGLLYYRDELAGGAKSRNQYRGGKGADEEAELDQFNGAEIIYDRGDKEVFLPNSCICRTGGYQWEVAAQMMNESGDFSGMNARWLMDAAKAPKPYIDLLSPDADIDTGLSDALLRLYQGLRNVPAQDYLLSYEAKVLFQAFQHQSVDEGDVEEKLGLQVAYPKNQSYVARLALLLHIVNAILRGESPEATISGSTMNKAIALAGYYLWQYRMIYKHNNPDSGLEGLGLKAHRYALKVGQVTASAVKRGVAAFRKVVTGTIRQVFESLAASGWGHTSGEGADMVYVPNSELNQPVDTIDGGLSKTSTAQSPSPKEVEPSVDEIDEIDKLPKPPGWHQLSEPGDLQIKGTRENHQFINSESQSEVQQGFEPVDGDVQPKHQSSTDVELYDDPSVRDGRNFLSEEEMAAWHLRLNACQTLDDATQFCTALDALTPLQRHQFETTVPDPSWEWLFNLPSVQQKEPSQSESVDEPTLEELKALLLASDSLVQLQQLKRSHKQTITQAYDSMSQPEQERVDAMGALAVPYKIFKYLGETIVQGSVRLLKGTLVYLDPATKLRASASSAPVWAINGVSSGWTRPVSVSISLLKEVTKAVLPNQEQDGGRHRGLI